MTSTVENLLESLGVDPSGVEAAELPHNRWLSPGVWRVRLGTGQLAVLKHTRLQRDRGETPWDAHWTAGDSDPRRWTYWCREPLAYQNDLAGAYAGTGIVAPGCLAVHIDDRAASLLLDWVAGSPGEAWPVDPCYGLAAEALGRAQAPFATGRELPRFSWLSERFLRQYSTEKPVDWDLLDDDSAWQHPVVRETFPAGLREGVAFVHANRERLYRINESLPRTLCHLDFWPKNLFRQADGRIVLIDWSFAGHGAVGEDVGNIVPDSVLDHFAASDALPDLERVVFDRYLRGLRAAGWTDDPRLVQLGMWSSAVKYDWLAPFTLAQVPLPRQYRYGGGAGIDASFRFRERSRVLLYTARWARQALELADELGIR
jgi:Phosphotransferase enzyme family